MDSAQSPEKQAILIRALELENTLARRKGFWRGFLAAILIFLLLLAGGAGVLYLKRHEITEWAINRFAIAYVEELIAGFPEAYMTHNQERVIQTLDQFTNAVAAKRVSRDDLEKIGRKFFATIKDKRISYKEMDDLLRAMENASAK